MKSFYMIVTKDIYRSFCGRQCYYSLRSEVNYMLLYNIFISHWIIVSQHKKCDISQDFMAMKHLWYFKCLMFMIDASVSIIQMGPIADFVEIENLGERSIRVICGSV